jgi:nicotinamide riboside transporter PnuC
MALELEIVSASLGIIGGIINVLKNKWGFALWVVGDTLWIIYGAITKQYFFMAQYIVFALIAVWGFKAWFNDEILAKKKVKGRK